eukprot:gene24962-biopygen10477
MRHGAPPQQGVRSMSEVDPGRPGVKKNIMTERPGVDAGSAGVECPRQQCAAMQMARRPALARRAEGVTIITYPNRQQAIVLALMPVWCCMILTPVPPSHRTILAL